MPDLFIHFFLKMFYLKMYFDELTLLFLFGMGVGLAVAASECEQEDDEEDLYDWVHGAALLT